MTAKSFLTRYWRVPLVAILGALIAFGGSFMLNPSYQSNTRLLIRGRATSFLGTTGQNLSQQPGIIDASMAKALAETQAGMASSREVAIRVVDQLGLDRPKADKKGPLATMAKAASWTYAHVRAWLTFGMYREADPREKAIATLQANVSAHQLGTTTAGATGQPSSYVLEVTAAGDSPEQARDIANVSAETLVSVSQERFQSDSRNYANSLQTQVTQANADLAATAQAVTDYKNSHNISALDTQLVNSAKNANDLTTQISQTEADLGAARASAASLQNTLSATDPNSASSQQIRTGRSATDVSSSAANPVYQNLQTQLSTANANVSALQARLATLQGQVSGSTPTALNQEQAGLLLVENQLSSNQDNLKKLTAQLGDAKANAATGQVDLTRVSDASLPTYPTSPKRYLYLLLGLLVGGLSGGGLTWLAMRRSPELEVEDGLERDASDQPDSDAEIDLTTSATNGDRPREPERVGVRGQEESTDR